MYAWARPLLFLLNPSVAHHVGMAGLWPIDTFLRGAFRPHHDPRLSVSTMGLTFPSPIGIAGGFDKNALRARALESLGFGFLELGTITREAQAANPPPNLFRLPVDRALINRLGFPNDGAAAVVERIKKMRDANDLTVPVGVSIGKSRSVPLDPIEGVIADYVSSFEHACTVADFIVVNVSSPNTKDLRAIQGAALAKRLLQALMEKNARSIPVLIKVAPDLSNDDLDALFTVAHECGLAGVVATNTTISRSGIRTPQETIDAIGAGGMSGPPLRERAKEVVRRARTALGPTATIIGVGGIETGDHAYEMLQAGANLVQVYTSFIYRGPFTATHIARELLAAKEKSAT